MKNIKVKNTYNEPFSYPSDCRRIAQAMAEAGYICSDEQARLLWELYSDSYAASWLILPETNEEIVSCISQYFEVIE